MATSALPSVGFTQTATTTTAEVTTAPFANTKEVIISNLSTADRLLVGWGDPDTANLTTATATIIPVSSALTLNIGMEGDRQPMFVGGGATDLNLLLEAETNTCEVNITYVNFRGINSAGGV